MTTTKQLLEVLNNDNQPSEQEGRPTNLVSPYTRQENTHYKICSCNFITVFMNCKVSQTLNSSSCIIMEI